MVAHDSFVKFVLIYVLNIQENALNGLAFILEVNIYKINQNNTFLWLHHSSCICERTRTLSTSLRTYSFLQFLLVNLRIFPDG